MWDGKTGANERHEIKQGINQKKGYSLSKKFTSPNYSSGSQQFDSAE